MDLRQFFGWCADRHLGLFDSHRSDVELYARELEMRTKPCSVGRALLSFRELAYS